VYVPETSGVNAIRRVICPAESSAEIVYCCEAVKVPAAENDAADSRSPYEPEPDAALTMVRREDVFAVGVNAVARVGLTPADAYTEVSGAVKIATPRTTVSPAAAVEGKLITIGVFEATPAR